ncbi:hypothetical protein C8Q72DRAFT_909925 [Fomitopsis betulina]|nr:hypothetical protein C8Q72DRAFT_909925 [Fomitopsis betulina]
MTSAWPVYIGTGLFTNSGSQCATVDAWAGGGDGGDELGDVAQSGGTVGMNDSVVLCMRASALPWFKLTELHLAMPRRTVGCHTEDSAMYAYLQLRVNGGLLRLKIGDTQQSRSIVAHGHLRLFCISRALLLRNIAASAGGEVAVFVDHTTPCLEDDLAGNAIHVGDLALPLR